MATRTARRMLFSGILGFGFFLVANFTEWLLGLNLLAAAIQLSINGLVFVAWRDGYRESVGLKKAFALIGTVVPIVMALITVVRVVLPALMC